MPANNPILGGKHISSYSNSAGTQGERPAAEVFSAPAGKSYNLPVAVIVGFCLLILIAYRMMGFQALVSARIGA